MEYLLDLAEAATESGPVPQEPVYGAAMGAFHLVTMDAGGHPGDAQARLIGLEQMRVRMEERAETGRAVIAAGDWNARWSNADDQNLLTRARDELGLIDEDAYLAVE